MTRCKNQRLWSAVIKGFITDKLHECAELFIGNNGWSWESFKFEEDSLNTNHFFHYNESQLSFSPAPLVAKFPGIQLFTCNINQSVFLHCVAYRKPQRPDGSETIVSADVFSCLRGVGLTSSHLLLLRRERSDSFVRLTAPPPSGSPPPPPCPGSSSSGLAGSSWFHDPTAVKYWEQRELGWQFHLIAHKTLTFYFLVMLRKLRKSEGSVAWKFEGSVVWKSECSVVWKDS